MSGINRISDGAMIVILASVFIVGVIVGAILGAGTACSAPDYQDRSTQTVRIERWFYDASGGKITDGTYRAFIIGADSSDADNQLDWTFDATCDSCYYILNPAREECWNTYRIDGTDTLVRTGDCFDGRAGAIGSADSAAVRANAIVSAHVLDHTLQAADYDTGSVTEEALGTGAVTANKIAGGAIDGSKLANTVTQGSADLTIHKVVVLDSLRVDGHVKLGNAPNDTVGIAGQLHTYAIVNDPNFSLLDTPRRVKVGPVMWFYGDTLIFGQGQNVRILRPAAQDSSPLYFVLPPNEGTDERPLVTDGAGTTSWGPAIRQTCAPVTDASYPYLVTVSFPGITYEHRCWALLNDATAPLSAIYYCRAETDGVQVRMMASTSGDTLCVWCRDPD